jgi:GNAT superfamily N-acetyltransferase
MGSRDDRFWAAFLGVDASAWASRGVSVRAHVGLVEYRGLWCFRRRDRVVVSAPAGWVAALERELDGREPDALLDEVFLASLLGDDIERVIGPAFQGCLEPSRFRPVVADGVRFVGPDDSAAVDRFRDECGEDVWQSGSLHKVENYMVAFFDGDEIVALAGYRPWNEAAGDPCVLTHPELHGKGHGTAVVSAVVAAALGEGKLLLYQTLEANRGAVQIALKLGYEQYARHLAVRLKRESPSDPLLHGA